jgi:hypothetical protein
MALAGPPLAVPEGAGPVGRDRSTFLVQVDVPETVKMRKLVRSLLVAAPLSLPLCLVPAGCSDDAGGNEAKVMEQTAGKTGTVAPNAPKNYEDYAAQRRKSVPK